MKIKILTLLSYVIPLLFTSCSRDEPFVAPPPPPPVQSNVKINEIYSRGTAANPDWIEIYNTSNTQIDLSGYKIYDIGGQGGTKPKKEFPAGSTLPANGFFVLVVDDTTSSGFGLSSDGETVWLENPSGSVIDNITFPALGVDTSYGRKPDGSNIWDKLSPPTKGARNDTSGIILNTVVMNEIYSRGTSTNPDWIEIYNPNSVQVDLTGYKIYDNAGQGGSKPKKLFPTGTIIPANGFYVIVTDDADPSGFGLSSSGETVWLENPSGAVIDNIAFPAMDVTQTYGRYPDGSANWQLLNTITRGSSNRP